MRGDPPFSSKYEDDDFWSTPHARGSTATLSGKGGRRMVYPACAGIHLADLCITTASLGLPRMRGDPPVKKSVF